jgi:hypothetical protein
VALHTEISIGTQRLIEGGMTRRPERLLAG